MRSSGFFLALQQTAVASRSSVRSLKPYTLELLAGSTCTAYGSNRQKSATFWGNLNASKALNQLPFLFFFVLNGTVLNQAVEPNKEKNFKDQHLFINFEVIGKPSPLFTLFQSSVYWARNSFRKFLQYYYSICCFYTKASIA